MTQRYLFTFRQCKLLLPHDLEPEVAPATWPLEGGPEVPESLLAPEVAVSVAYTWEQPHNKVRGEANDDGIISRSLSLKGERKKVVDQGKF